ncbi:MAG TPA: phospholipid carrier-dependent glycosyltransferase [Gemmatimonadaceae bacterium]|nr:phospholipid carrier-dependent glycosyltransferase [Gemmatimonadaceae bacterium]
MFTLRAELRRPEFLALTAAAVLTRFWSLFSPHAVVWDEVHYERFAGSYLVGKNYLDVHPPLGKLLLAGAAKLLHVPGQALLTAQPEPVLRILPALAGALIIPVALLILRALGASRRVAAFAGAFLVVDNALLVESRFILTDSMLILFVFLALLLFLVGREREGGARTRWLIAAGLVAGMAASVKWTGLAALGLMLAVILVDAVTRRARLREWFGQSALLASMVVAVYVASFAIHFAVLGPAAQYADLSFPRAFLHLNRDMQAVNAAWSGTAHPSASLWYTWPIAKHPPGLWYEPPVAPDAVRRWIVMYGNPVVWWGTLIGMGTLLIAWIRKHDDVARHRGPLLFLAAGYALNFAPFAFITRPMYLYHYLVAMIFSVMLASWSAGILFGWSRDDGADTRGARALYAGVLALATATFFFLAPLSYGTPLTPRGVAIRQVILQRHNQGTPGS